MNLVLLRDFLCFFILGVCSNLCVSLSISKSKFNKKSMKLPVFNEILWSILLSQSRNWVSKRSLYINYPILDNSRPHENMKNLIRPKKVNKLKQNENYLNSKTVILQAYKIELCKLQSVKLQSVKKKLNKLCKKIIWTFR